MFAMSRLIANAQEKGTPTATGAKDNDRQFVENEI